MGLRFWVEGLGFIRVWSSGFNRDFGVQTVWAVGFRGLGFAGFRVCRAWG